MAKVQKVQIEQTSKGIKVFWLLAQLIGVVGLISIGCGSVAPGIVMLLLCAVMSFFARVAKWWCND